MLLLIGFIDKSLVVGSIHQFFKRIRFKLNSTITRVNGAILVSPFVIIKGFGNK